MTNRRSARLPKARRFAAVRMDPVAMVEHLQDPAATHAAKRMRPKNYLVYLEFPEDLPMPDSPWCRYRISPIATTLRPANPEKGITPDMVAPIYPNTDYSKGNIHISSTPPFPFPNCYFWAESRMSLRVRVSRGLGCGYDNDKAYQLSIPQHLALANSFEHALDIICRHQQNLARTETHTRPTWQNKFHSTFDAHSTHDEFAVTDDDSDSYPVSDRPLSPSLPPSITDLFALNLFGWDDDPTFQFIPLVDLRFEVEETFKSDTIPSPAELWKEQATISRQVYSLHFYLRY
ncbi:hypothetical protein C8Q74DRAFT_1191217 [Fomes fomentarius]|nr:hypothetical protein C8Q74DRAFT_1191217 [Fomes fomentarius]